MMGLAFILIFFITSTFAMERAPIISEALKTRKLYQADFKELGVEYLSSLQTHLDRTKIKPRKPFALEPDLAQFELLLAAQQKDYELQIDQCYCAPVYIKYINDKVGFGVFAEDIIKEFNTVAEYTGLLCIEDDEDQEEDTDFAIDVGPFYASESTPKLFVDAKKSGNCTRFINHSYIPNVNSLSVYNKQDGLWHVMMHATTDIPAGAQLLINYGPGYWEARELEPIDLYPNP